MFPGFASLAWASLDAVKKVDSLAREHGRDHPMYHEANLAAMTADANLMEAAMLYEAEKRPVCTQRIEEYRALLASFQRSRDVYRRKHIPGGSHGLFTLTLPTYTLPQPACMPIAQPLHCMPNTACL